MSLIHNERIKLLANALNNTAVAIVVTGIVAPFVGFIYGSPSAVVTKWWPLIGIGLLLAGVILHFVAQAVLRRLKE